MYSARCSLLIFLGMVAAGFAVLPSPEGVRRRHPADDKWKNHPALAEPNGRSHRGDKMVAANVEDPRVLDELSRRFRQTKLQDEDFGRQQEYFLRLLDYYWFSKPRLVGMNRAEVEEIFGPLGRDPERADISAGRDVLCLWFKNGRVSDAFYAMGY